MIVDEDLADLALRTRQTYVRSVVKLQEHYHWKSHNRMTEKEVRAYLLCLRDEENCSWQVLPAPLSVVLLSPMP